MKKLLALLLVVATILSLAACVPADVGDTTTGPNGPEDPNATYTYHGAAVDFPTVWNPHTYETNTDADILDYISVGFYTFDYNEAGDGYALVPHMVKDDHPVDVTSQYVGKYGIVEGDSAKAYILNLRDDLKWEDGTAITAEDFVESAKRLLYPNAYNHRADSLYSGNMVIYGAEKYLKAGTITKEPVSADGETTLFNYSDMIKGEDGQYTDPNGAKLYFGLQTAYKWLGSSGYTLTKYANAGYIPAEGCWDILSAAANSNGYVPVNDETIAALLTFTSSDVWGNETQDYLVYYMSYDYENPEYGWDGVGMEALSDTELLLVLTKPLEGFYLKYSLTSSWLVHIPTYDKCITEEDGVYNITYGTTVDTTMSYGPYKLTYFEKDKQYILTRNEYYFDLSDDTYQTTSIVIDEVAEASTRLELFLQGKLDSYGLTIDDMETYQRSDYTYFSKGASTFAMVFNPDYDALVTSQKAAGDNVNKTILTLVEFRMAMSLAMDRSKFCLATSPLNSAAFGLYSSLIIYDPDAGIPYRTTDVAKKALAEFWGVDKEIGEGKLYADIDEAIESITGYDLSGAKKLFDEAYDKAIAQGLMDADDKVVICVGTPNNTSKFYNNGYQFIVDNYTEAVKGTKLEGKLEFTRDDTLGNAFGDALKANQVDMLFGVGWTGSTLDPYNLMGAYIEPDYIYDACTDFKTIYCDVELDGVAYTASAYDWYMAMMGEKITIKDANGNEKEFSCGTADNDPETRLQILGVLEGVVLQNYNFIPLMDESSANLKSMKINYKTEEYVFGMGFGGIKYYTYNYSDTEWDAFVASQGGKLNYN